MKYTLIACIVLSSLNSAELSCDSIEVLHNQIPAGVCISDIHQQSHIFECSCNRNINTAEMNQLTYNNSNCFGSLISINSYSQYLQSENIDFQIFCKGIPCNYGIRSSHPTANCSDDVPTVSNFSHDGDTYIIGSCETLEASSYKIDSCINELNAEKSSILYYEDSTDCSTTGELVEAYCDEYGTQYEIKCVIAETQNINNINCDSTPPKEPSLYGTWSHHGIFGFEIEINSDCTEIIFTLVSPQNDTWFAVGMGGDYYRNTGENVMNGYAIVQLFSSLEMTYETALYPGETPFPHNNLNMDCENKETDGIRTSVCNREYITGETEQHDFYEFTVGGNDIVWAFGDVGDMSGFPLKHGLNGIGESHIDVIYLHGEKDNLCGYAKEFENRIDKRIDNRDLSFSTEPPTARIKPMTSPYDNGQEIDNIEHNEEWVILGIVFIILFGITFIVLVYFMSNYWCKRNQKYANCNTKTHSEDVESDADEAVTLETVKFKDKYRGEINKVPEHSDIDCD